MSLIALRNACLGLFLLAASAMAVAVPLSLRFENIGVEQGLPQESITSVLQDRHGYIWIGTQAGLSRYDGYRLTVFKNDSTNPRSLIDNFVQALYEDAAGQLWIGTKSGLERYDRVTQSFIHQPIPTGNLSVTSMTGDGKQGMWLATRDGLVHLDPISGQMRALQHRADAADSLGDNRLSQVITDRLGNLWLGTDSGIEMLPAGASRFLHLSAPGPANQSRQIMAMSLSADGVLWAGTLSGLQAWRLRDGTPQALPLAAADALADQRVRSLLHDREGNLWVGSGDGSLRRRDPATGRFHLHERNSMGTSRSGGNFVSALYQDRTGTLWVGNWFSGLDRVDLASGGFERYADYSGGAVNISSNKVSMIAGAGQHRLWLAKSEGLVRLNTLDGKRELWRYEAGNPRGLPGDHLTALAVDHQDRLWVGSNTGLAWRDPASGIFTHITLDPDPAAQRVLRLAIARDGALWVATRAGLHRRDPAGGAVTTYRHDDASHNSVDGRIHALLEDRQGTLWVGTDNGLDRLDRATGRFRHYRHDPDNPDSLRQKRVHDVYEDAKGRLWIGTAAGVCEAVKGADGGLTFRSYPLPDGRAPDPVGTILGDDQGRLWISTTSGITVFDPATSIFKDYTGKDGLIESSYFIGAGYKAPDGTLYFGGMAGLSAFQPSRIHDNPFPPQLALTDFYIFNQSILGEARRPDVLGKVALDEARSLTLDHRDAMFSIEFAALHFADPQRNRYAYQLEGFDPQWVATDAGKRYATYTNLDPGRYVFRVRAASKDGVWTTAPLSLELIITPPFWMTWWFRGALLGLLVGCAWLLFRVRVRMLMRQKQSLERQVDSRTRELMGQNASIERQKREVEHQKESVELAHRNISLLSDIGRRITANLDNEAIMSMLYQQVHALMDASVFGIGIYRPEQELIEYPFAMERGKRYTPYTRSMLEPNQLAVWCIQHAMEVFINELDLEYPRYIANLKLVSGAENMGTLEDGSLPTEPRSLIYVPILVASQVRGVITVHSYRAHAYRRIDLDMLTTLASYVGVAFANADSFRQLQDAQQQLVEREKLAALGSLVAGVAHELNTPIGNSLVIASTLEDKTAEIELRQESNTLRRSDLRQFIDDAREASTLLMRSLRNAAELVDSFKQVAVDQASAKRRHFNLLQASQEIVTMMKNQIRKAGHQIELEMPDDIAMDSFPGPYGQVIINLINNALLHAFEGRQGGALRLWALRLGPDRVRVVFEDDGCGIALAHQARIFDPFFTTKLGQGGNGLGLSITYNIVTSLLDGGIRVDSAVGVGTRFTIDLPLRASLSSD